MDRIQEISDYIGADSPMAAEKWVNTVFDKTDSLVGLPNSGRIVPELRNPEIREVIFGNYRIIYKIGTDVLSVLTIRHTKQILPTDEL